MQEEISPTNGGQSVNRAEHDGLDFASQAAASIGASSEKMSAFVGQFAEAARADACVGLPQTANGHTVVPLATVTVQAGFGLGFGGGGGAGPEDEGAGSGSGGGGGGAGRASSRVIAMADISDQGVRIQPVPDVTRIALAFMALLGVRLLTGRRAGSAGPAEKAARRRMFASLRPGREP